MKHYFDEIQGWFKFKEPYRDAIKAASDASTLVEMGCWKGKSASFLLVEAINAGKTPIVHFIDHWGGSNEPEHKADPELERIFEHFLTNVRRSGYPNANVHRMDTVAAADLFDPGSIDFIWIDAGHEYDQVMGDIRAWWPKLKPGGIMGGDDLPMEGVNKAVREFFPDHEVGSEDGWQWWRVRKKG